MSDAPCALACLASLLLAWHSRERQWESLPAGLLFGVAVLIRPTSVLLGPALLIASGFSWSRWTGLVLGSLPGVAAMCGFNWHLYHNPFRSGYGSVFEIFGWQHVAPSLRSYATWGIVCFSPLAVVGPLAILRRELRARPLVLALWVWAMVLAVFYAFYLFTWQEWWYLRFLLPAGPGMTILGLLVLGWFARSGNRNISLRALCIAVVLACAWDLGWTRRLHATSGGTGDKVYAEACEWAKRELPSNAYIVCGQCSGAVFFYLDNQLIRRDAMREGAFGRICEVAKKEGRAVYAMMYEDEGTCLDEEGLSGQGRWRRVGDVRHISFWKLEP